jgi:hypothetical protein
MGCDLTEVFAPDGSDDADTEDAELGVGGNGGGLAEGMRGGGKADTGDAGGPEKTTTIEWMKHGDGMILFPKADYFTFKGR